MRSKKSVSQKPVPRNTNELTGAGDVVGCDDEGEGGPDGADEGEGDGLGLSVGSDVSSS